MSFWQIVLQITVILTLLAIMGVPYFTQRILYDRLKELREELEELENNHYSLSRTIDKDSVNMKMKHEDLKDRHETLQFIYKKDILNTWAYIEKMQEQVQNHEQTLRPVPPPLPSPKRKYSKSQ